MVVTTQNILADVAQLQKDAEALQAEQPAATGNAAALQAVAVTVNNAVGQIQALATRLIAQSGDATEVQNQAQALQNLAASLQAAVAGIVAA